MSEHRLRPEFAVAETSTAGALVAAAMAIFGRKGFDATSTREIATAAKTNIASIAYHFAGKDGLRLACAKAFAARIGTLIEQVSSHDPDSPAEAEAILLRLVDQLARHLIADRDMQPFAAFALREISDGGPGIDIIFSGLVDPAHRRLCAIWSLATGQPAEDEDTKLIIFSMIGQILYFRIGAEIVKRRMGWTEIGDLEAGQIVQTLRTNLRDLIDARRRGCR